MKIFWSILSAIVVIVILSFLFVYFKFNYVLGHILSSKFNTKVKIEKVVFKSPEIDVLNFEIHNPSGYSLPLALSIDDVYIKAPFRNYFHRVINIDQIEVRDAEVNIEFSGRRGTESNWSHLIGHISSGSEDDSKAKQSDSKGRYAVIGLLTIRNLRVNIITPGQKTQTKVFRDMQFRNVVTKKGDISRRITQVIIYHMIFNYKNLIKIPQQFGNKATDGALNFFEKLGPFKFNSN